MKEFELELGGTQTVSGGAERAYRYSLQRPLQFRRLGQEGWSNGATHNISRSGLLFLGPEVLDIGDDVELHICLRIDPRQQVGDIVAVAQVVRRAASSTPEFPMAAGVKFTKCQLAPYAQTCSA